MPINVLEKAKSKGVHLSVSDGRLKVRAKQGALDDELRQEITQMKELLIELISEVQFSKLDQDKEIIKPVTRNPAGSPLSFAQQRLWFIDQHEADSSQYNIPTALTLSGELNRSALQKALDTLLERHEILRTTYAEVDEVAVQVINPPTRLVITEVDLSKLEGTSQTKEVEDLVRLEANKAFNLSQDLMLRVSLLRLSATEHVLLFTMHHIASDGWSVGVLTKEFVALYGAFCRGHENTLTPLEIQYADFAHWQRENLSDDTIASQLEYWEKELAGIPTVHRLPIDVERPAEQQFKGQTFTQNFDTKLMVQLNQLAQEHGATLFMLLESAFALLLARWSHEDDIVIGTPIAGRTHSQLEPLIGFFVNTLVFRHQLNREQSFIELLIEAKKKALDTYANQDVPFEMIVDKLQPKRSLSHSPLFQVLFALQNNEQVSLDLPNLSIDGLSGGQETIKFDLELAINESETGLWLNWTYACSLFHAATIERMSKSFEVLLRSIVAAPSTSIYRLELSTEEDKQQQLALLHQSGVEFCEESYLHQLFEQQVKVQPDAMAAIFENTSLTYRELNERANQVAHQLIESGVKPDTLVGLCVERSLEMVVGILAVWKAGGAYLPIDPNYPQSRVDFMLQDSAVKILLTHSRVSDRKSYKVKNLLLLDNDCAFSHFSTSSPRVEGLAASNLAYVIYTSGSTGKPKGVCVEHRSLSHLSYHLDKITNKARMWAWMASYVFDASLQGLTRLAYGGCLLILDDQYKLDIERLKLVLDNHPVDIMDCTPSIVESWLNQDSSAVLPNLIIGGESISPVLWERLNKWQEECKRIAINAYGPTECCVNSTWTYITGKRPHIGKALGNNTLCVLSDSGKLLPMGVPGELHVGGVGLARGYLSQPELTSDKFANFSSESQSEKRLYKTGDIVRWLEDGNLEFLGRIDDQVKVRGFRIELGEIEQQLNLLDVVQASAVLVVDSGGNQKQLVAYVVPEQTIDDSFNEIDFVDSLRKSLGASLADYMVPSAFKVLTKLPLTANGKLDKKALSLLETSDQREGSYAGPRNATEATLCKIWQTLLNIEKIGIHDNFFQLGGDSILSIQVVARANKVGIAITTRKLFACQTIAELSSEIANEAEIVDAPQHAIQGELTLLPIQKEFLSSDNNCVNHFNQTVLLVPPQKFEVNALKTIVESLYRKHDALRLRFDISEDNCVATHHPLTDKMIDESCVIEYLPYDVDSVAKYITQRCDHYQRSINISEGPIFRAVYFEGAETTRLFFVAHHMVVDGVSWRILLADLEQAYSSYQSGEEVSLAAKTSSFQQWGAALADYSHSEAMQQEKAFWRAQYNELILPLPIDFELRQTPKHKTNRVVRLELSVEETTKLLKQCSTAYRTSINELLLSGVYLGMRRWTQSSSLRVTLEGHGREDLFEKLDTTQTVGWFTTTYPLMLSCDDSQVSNVIKNIKEQYRSIPNKGIGYGILRYLADDPELAQAEKESPTQLLFNYLGQFDQTLSEDTLFHFALESAGTDIDPERLRDHTLGLNGLVAQGKLQFELDYSGKQFKAETVEKLAKCIEDELRFVIKHCVAIGDSNLASNKNSGILTPSDFPLARVTPAQLNEWQNYYDIDNLYPATSMQQGMLFHSMLDAAAYVSQIYPTFTGILNSDYFRQAWQLIVDRYDIFRTVFVGDGEELHQLIVKNAQIPWYEEDLRSLSDTQQAQRFEEFRLQDKALGFDVTQAPMQRISVFQLSDNRFRVLWSSHHMLLDGWSTPLVYRDVMAAYHALLNDESIRLPAVAPYSNYIAWLHAQDREAAAGYWRTYLSDLGHPTPLVLDQLAGDREQGHRSQSIQLSEEASDKLQAFAKRSRTTVNTLMQLAWGLLLHRYSGERNVLFGATISGRSAAVPGVESMVGLFINTIPVKISFEQTDMALLLSTLHQSFQDSNDFGYLPLPEIQAHSPIANGMPLFNSLIAFENFPIDAATDASADATNRGLAVDGLGADEQTNYKLTLVATMQEALTISCRYRGDDFSEIAVEHMLEQLVAFLTQLPLSDSVETIELPEDEFHTQLRRIAADTSALAARQASDAMQLTLVDGEAQAPVRPRTQTEADMLNIWQEILAVEISNIQDNFFDLGGNSLKAMRVVSHVAAHFGVEKSVKSLFINNTIESLSAYVDSQKRIGKEVISAVDKTKPLPLSFSQQPLWVFDQMNGGSPQYNMPITLRLRGELNCQAVHRSLNTIVERHAVLRTVFMRTEKGPVQVVQPYSSLAYPVLDLTGFDGDAQAEAVAREVCDEAATVFDLAHDLMLRVRLLVLGECDHVLLLTMHHIASDGWSIGILTREFVTLYEAYCEGREPGLPELEIQYADYAHWQRETLTEDCLEAQWQYWERLLSGAPAVHSLPLDKPRPAQQKFTGAVHAQVMGRDLLEGLEALCKRQDVTLFMVLQSTFALLLSRWSREEDIVLASPMSGRAQNQLEGLIGFFVNTVVFRYALSSTKSFAELLAESREQVVEAYANQDISLEMLVNKLQSERSLSHNPVAQVMFSLQNQDMGELRLEGLEIEGVGEAAPVAKFDLDLGTVVQSGELHLMWRYATSLFEAETIERMAASFELLLRAIVADQNRKLDAFPLIGTEARQQVLEAFNETASAFPGESLIQELFEAQVAVQPEAEAVVCEDQSLTFGGLNARANQLAHYLITLGVKPDDRVGICVERGLEMVVGLLGILKAGAAYVPLDRSYPLERLAYMLRDSAPVALLTQQSTQSLLPDVGVPVLCLDAPSPDMALARQPDHNPDARALGISSNHLAYVIYTSGSAGNPKGVMIEHRSVINLWAGLGEYLHEAGAPPRRVGLNASIAFDASVQSLTQLLSGSCVVVIPQNVRMDADALLRYIKQEKIQLLDCTPTQLQVLLAAGFLDQDEGNQCCQVLVGGEPIPHALGERIAGAPGVVFYNVYGLTECTVNSTLCIMQRTAHGYSIGRPLPNIRAYILDETRQPVPIGVTGELYIGGAGLARGYLNQPDLTAERFILDPFRAMPSALMYKTGDLARWLPDGNIEYLGRDDFQVKIRGVRIELGEIEAQLSACAGVREAAVVAHAGSLGEKCLVAYVVMEEGQALVPAEIRAQLAANLPESMLPSSYVAVASFPKTPSGKLDRNALPALDSKDKDAADDTYAAPRGEREETLARIWQELLGLERVGRNDNFFDIGGNSIRAIQTVTMASKVGLDLKIGNIFKFQTIESICSADEAVPGAEVAQADEAGYVRELSPYQCSVLDSPEKDVANWHAWANIGSGFTETYFRHVVRETVARFPTLGMLLVENETSYDMKLAENMRELLRTVIEVHDVSGMQEEAVVGYMEDVRKQQDGVLSTLEGPLLRASLFVGDGPSTCSLNAHRVLLDEGDWEVISKYFLDACLNTM